MRTGYCPLCGGFHFRGKRLRRQRNGFLLRLYRKRAKEMAEVIDQQIWYTLKEVKS